MQTQNDIETLMRIKSADDVASVEVELYYEDDHQQCANVRINGAYIEFLWYDNLGFLEYWQDSAKAKADLFHNMQHQLYCHCIEGKCIDGEATKEMEDWANAYNAKYWIVHK